MPKFNEILLPEFEEEMINTRRLLERVPDNHFDYKPHPKSMPLGRLATHIAELPGWIKNTLEREVLEMSGGFQPNIAGSRQELLDIFDKNTSEARSALSGATDNELSKTWTFKFDGKVILSMPRFKVLRTLCLNHLIHHRAQLGVYLRENNIEIPGMYGPSADEMKFWEKAQAS
jgi:uncharacterized damage-inducible protein DinB